MIARRDAAYLAGLAVLLAGTSPAYAGSSRPALRGIEEPSGVTRSGDRLLIVGDDEDGAYFSLKVTGDELGLVPLHSADLTRHELSSGLAALDLESVDVLPDGRVIVLSERFPAIFDEHGILVPYGKRFAEIGGLGPEGLAVLPQDDGSARIAILWEGGYPRGEDLPVELEADVPRRAFAPRVLVHRLKKGARAKAMDAADIECEVSLQVPKPEGQEPFVQRFRAPDLVWHRVDRGRGAEWGWIVLMSSGWGERPRPGTVEECTLQEDGKPVRWCHRYLLRFGVDGAPVGEPFDLDSVLPEALRTANWEGLGWFETGEQLVLVYDESIAARRLDPQQAFVMSLPAGW